jgi:transcription antitermination factor NusG
VPAFNISEADVALGGDRDALTAKFLEPHWYATYTRSRHEKRVAEQLERKHLEYFLPSYQAIRQWKNGKARVEFPLFPGYIFVRIPLRERLQVLEVPGVVRLVGFNGLPAPLPQSDIEIMRDALRKGIEAAPHPYLTVGTRVRIKNGPLQGLQGILLRRKGNPRVVVSVELIMRSIAIDIDIADIEPVR